MVDVGSGQEGTRRSRGLVIGLLVAVGVMVAMVVLLIQVGAWASVGGGCGGG